MNSSKKEQKRLCSILRRFHFPSPTSLTSLPSHLCLGLSATLPAKLSQMQGSSLLSLSASAICLALEGGREGEEEGEGGGRKAVTIGTEGVEARRGAGTGRAIVTGERGGGEEGGAEGGAEGAEEEREAETAAAVKPSAARALRSSNSAICLSSSALKLSKVLPLSTAAGDTLSSTGTLLSCTHLKLLAGLSAMEEKEAGRSRRLRGGGVRLGRGEGEREEEEEEEEREGRRFCRD